MSDLTWVKMSLSHEYDEEGCITQHQNIYLRNLEHLPLDAGFTDFRSMRMRRAWFANTRPDCLFEISQLAQITEDRFTKDKNVTLRRLNETAKVCIDNRVKIKITLLDKDSIRVIGYADASFVNSHDLSTQQGHICFLADKHVNVVPIDFKSYKSRRVVRSVMVGEVIAFSDLSDRAATLAAEVGDILDRKIPVQHLTDSKSFDVISKGSRTSEKRVMCNVGYSCCQKRISRKCNFRYWFRSKLVKSCRRTDQTHGSSHFTHCTINRDSGNQARAMDYWELI